MKRLHPTAAAAAVVVDYSQSCESWVQIRTLAMAVLVEIRGCRVVARHCRYCDGLVADDVVGRANGEGDIEAVVVVKFVHVESLADDLVASHTRDHLANEQDQGADHLVVVVEEGGPETLHPLLGSQAGVV